MNSYFLIVKYKDAVSHEIKLNTSVQGSFLSLEQHILIDDMQIGSGDIVKQDYTSKVKTKNLFDKQLLAQNNDTTLIQNNNPDKIDEVGKIYSIQLLSSKTAVPLSSFGELQDVKEYKKNDGYYIYFIGEFTYEWEATIKLRMVKENYPRAIVFVNTFGGDN